MEFLTSKFSLQALKIQNQKRHSLNLNPKIINKNKKKKKFQQMINEMDYKVIEIEDECKKNLKLIQIIENDITKIKLQLINDNLKSKLFFSN